MKTLKLVLGYLRHNLMSGMAYRKAFFLQVFGMLLNDLLLLVFWVLLFRRFPTVNGWDLTGVITLYSIVAAGVGLGMAICGNSGRLAEIIASGNLDYYLVLPADPLVHALVSASSIPSWGDLAFGLVIYAVAVPGSWRSLPLFLTLTVLTAVIYIAFSVIVESLAFWIGQAQALAQQLQNAILTFGLYPIDIFPGAVRIVLYTLIPAAFLGSLPARLLRDFSWQGFAAVGGAAILTTALARWVFYRGLRHYESGNLVVTRG